MGQIALDGLCSRNRRAHSGAKCSIAGAQITQFGLRRRSPDHGRPATPYRRILNACSASFFLSTWKRLASSTVSMMIGVRPPASVRLHARRHREHPAVMLAGSMPGFPAVLTVPFADVRRSGLPDVVGPGGLQQELPLARWPVPGIVAIVFWKACRAAVRRCHCRLRRSSGRPAGPPVLRHQPAGPAGRGQEWGNPAAERAIARLRPDRACCAPVTATRQRSSSPKTASTGPVKGGPPRNKPMKRARRGRRLDAGNDRACP
jgi:hypothetical protein